MRAQGGLKLSIALTATLIIFLIINISLLYCLLTRKRCLSAEIGTFGGVLLLIVSLLPFVNQLVQNQAVSLFLGGNLFLIPALILFKEHWKVKVFTFYLIFTSSQYTSLLLSFIDFYGRTAFGINLSLEGIRLLFGCVELCIFIFAYPYIIKSVKPFLAVISKESVVFILLPLGACVMLAITRANKVFDFYSVIITSLVTCILLTVLYLLNLTIRLMDSENHLKNQLLIQLDHYKTLTEGIEKTRIYQHDFRHHLASVRNFLKMQDIAATQAYLDTLKEEYTKCQLPIFCENKYVDAVVAHYAKIAREASIAISIELCLPDKAGIEPLDLCVIIGNCFENAIEACRAIPNADERQIGIRAKIAHGYAAITLKNTCVNEIKRQKKRFLSSKEPNRLGIGLESVRLLTHKYDGDIQVYTEQGNFIVAISLKIPTQVNRGAALGHCF